jgi:hypothetical protein
MTNPIKDPRSHDIFSLDGVDCPGLSTIKSGGDREQEWQQQAVMLSTSVNIVLRKELPSSITYLIEVWSGPQFTRWEAFIAMLNQGKAKRPPRVYRLSDPRVAHNAINQVVYGSCSAQQKLAPGKWGYELKLLEKPKAKPLGGPAQPAKTEQERRNDALNQEAVNLGKQLAALQAAAAKGK